MTLLSTATQRKAESKEQESADREPLGATFLLSRIGHITNDAHEHRPQGQREESQTGSP